jgi:glycosyltransferase involved in cell wall biosynthesis
VLDMARAVARRGHEVAIYTTDRACEPAERLPFGQSVMRDGVELRMFAEQQPRVVATSWPLYRALSERIARVDIVHLHSLYLFHVWAAARIARRVGVPYLLRPHGTLDPFLWKRHRLRKRIMELAFQDRAIRGAAALHFTAQEELELARPYSHGVPGVVVPNGLNIAEFEALPAPGGLRRAHPEIGARRVVLFLSRLNFKKGLDLLIPGFARARARHPDLHLVIAGPDDGMRGQVERWVAQNNVADAVTLTGMLTGVRKLEALVDAYCFVLPSYSENFGIAIVEAMACGVPVAISDKVNIWREVVDGGAGLVGPTTIDGVAEQIARLAADPEASRRMGVAGSALARARFSWDRIAVQLEDAYRDLARLRRAA